MSSTGPTVSVVVPCYRYGRFLPECVASILDQAGVEVRVLIIDDASPDDSFEVAQRLATSDPRVAARRHETNHGHISTYNEGLLEWADGEYSVLISADDVLATGALARATAVMQAHPEVGFVYGHAVNWRDDQPRRLARVQPRGVTIWPGQEWLQIVCGLGHTVITSPEVVVRTALQQKLGGYLPELPHTGDAEMWMRFAAHADVAYLRGVDQAFYRIHATNMTTTRSPVIDLQQRRAAFDAFFDTYGDQVDHAAARRVSAERKIAKEALWRACRAHERRTLDTTPVAELHDLALATYAQSPRLPEYWGFRWRQMVGPRITPYLQVFMLSAVHRHLRKRLWWRRWARKGY